MKKLFIASLAAILAGCASTTAITPAANERPVEFGTRIAGELSSGLDKLIVKTNTKIVEQGAVQHLNVHFIPYETGHSGVLESFNKFCTAQKGKSYNGACVKEGEQSAPMFIVDSRKAAIGKGTGKVGGYVELNVMEPMPGATPDDFIRDSLALIKTIPGIVAQKKEAYRDIKGEQELARWNAWTKAVAESGCMPFDTVCLALHHNRKNRY